SPLATATTSPLTTTARSRGFQGLALHRLEWGPVGYRVEPAKKLNPALRLGFKQAVPTVRVSL
ncbi:hypothetical protein JWR97_22290, partial [Pseudomonas cedrina subsp. fulgida]|nr:hypothetical protein [Pseudomonas cedrina subsp. fulgida]